jgi:hypothetical protein
MDTIIRIDHSTEKPYVMIRRDTLQDEKLSWEARGMLAYLLSKPNDWEVKPDDLQQKCGKDKTYRILSELKTAGYVKHNKIRDPKTQHITASHYIIFEEPSPVTAYINKADEPYPEKPDTANPDSIQKKEEQKNTAESVFTSVHTDSVGAPENPKSEAPLEAHGFKASDLITQGDKVLGKVGEKRFGISMGASTDEGFEAYLKERYPNPGMFGLDGMTIAKAHEDYVSSLTTNDGTANGTGEPAADIPSTALEALRYLQDGTTLYLDARGEGVTYTYAGIHMPEADFMALLKAGYIDDVEDEWQYVDHDAGYRITTEGRKRLSPKVDDIPSPSQRFVVVHHTDDDTYETWFDTHIEAVNDGFPDGSTVYEIVGQQRVQVYPAVVPQPAPAPVVALPDTPALPTLAYDGWELPCPAAPDGYEYLYSAGSLAVIHLVKAGKAEHGKPLCKVSVKHRTEKTAGLECLKRPVCAECLKIATAPKPEKKPRVKAPPPYDGWGEAIATHLFGAKDKAGVNAVYGRVAPILHGDKRSGRCNGLIAYECERQGKDKADLDYAALAKDTEAFWKDFQKRNPNCQLKDCAKVVDAWQAWRGKPQPKPFNPDEWKIVEPDMYVVPGPAR